MFIDSKQYNILEAACGIQLIFDTVSPKPRKIGDIISASRSRAVSTIEVINLSEIVNPGQKISILQSPNLNVVADVSPIPDSFVGDFVVKNATRDSTNNSSNISFDQNLQFTNATSISAELYKQGNVVPAEQYYVQFVIESKVPNSADVSLRPYSYIVSGYDEFVPTVILEAKSRFSKSIKILVKMLIRDANSNRILKTEYKEIVVADSASRPCEIIYTQPIEKTYIDLKQQNSWIYYHEGYLLAEFLPNKEYKNIIVKLIKKDSRLLPSRLNNNRLRIVADPIKLQAKKTNIDKIRSAILNQYDTINNSLAIANIGNRSYDIVVEDKLLKPEDLADVIVDIVPPETGVPIKFSDVAKATNYDQDLDSLPKVSLLKWNNIFLGELHYNPKIYDQDAILIDISGNNSLVLSGSIKDVTNGINFMVDPTPTPTPTRTPTPTPTMIPAA